MTYIGSLGANRHTKMITQEQFEMLLPLACAWAEEQERVILRDGVSLTPAQTVDAAKIGVAHPERVRLLSGRIGFHKGCPTTSPAIWFTKEQSFSESRLRASYVTAVGHLFTIFIPLRRTHRSSSTKQTPTSNRILLHFNAGGPSRLEAIKKPPRFQSGLNLLPFSRQPC